MTKAQEKFKRLRSLLEGYERPSHAHPAATSSPVIMTPSAAAHHEQQNRAAYLTRVRALLKLPTKSTFFPGHSQNGKIMNDDERIEAGPNPHDPTEMPVRSSEPKKKKPRKESKKKKKKTGPLKLNEKEFNKRAALDPNLYQVRDKRKRDTETQRHRGTETKRRGGIGKT